MNKHNITDMVLSALLTAVICILSQISFIISAVPLTFQTLGVSICGFVLKPKQAFACVFTHLALGGLGLPVFSGFQGGFQVLSGPNGGFLFGFIALCLACSFSCKIKNRILKWTVAIFGVLICHGLGVIQYSLVTGNNILISVLSVSLPFVGKDIICIFGAYFLSKYIKIGSKL